MNSAAPSFPALVQNFFTHYLVEQRALSPCTVAAYRDAFMLLLNYAERKLGKAPTKLLLADLDPTLILGFLDELETVRGNSVRTRNARLAAIRSFLQFASRSDVAHLHSTAKALAVPMKRFDRPILGYLSREQMLYILELPGTSWIVERDRLLLQLLYNTGARISEMLAVKVENVVIGDGACIHLMGKGRKQRSVPLWPVTSKLVSKWLVRNKHPPEKTPLLPARGGSFMTRANASQRIAQAVKKATEQHPELATINISPHTLRHTTAMHLLQAGVDISVIALWLGHESPSTTHMYIEADLKMKEQALARVQPANTKLVRYQPPDALSAFLHSL